MPFPVSDVMANYMSGGPNHDNDEQGFIIITGGCNSPKGNERIQVDIDDDDGNGTKKMDLFECLSITNTTLKFDPFHNTFTYMTNMPHERTRHAATIIHNELYVIGGRDNIGNMVTAIDVRNDDNVSILKKSPSRFKF
jgi:Kelch motif